MSDRPPTSVVGRSVPRVDAAAKATGSAVYGVDVHFPGMLVGRVLRAGVPHARIARLDATAALQVPGVRAVVTGADCARRHGLFVKDQPALAVDRVRFAGEVAAAVAADDDEAAQEALERIEVEYEELPVVTDVLQAMAPGAPLLHPDQASYERADVPGMSLDPVLGTNISYHFKLRKGDVDAAFAAADLVVEDTFTTPFIQYAHLEPHVTIARWGADGVLTLWTSTMGPHTVRGMMAELLDLPLGRVRVITQMVGGGYGSKMYLRAINPAVALLAMKLPGRHVRMLFDREDEFLSCNGRLPTVTSIKTGARRDGTLVARQSRVVWAQGAYADIGAVIARNASYCSLGPYRIPHARIDAYLVYTNRQPGGGFRGLGIPQVAWAGEQQMDRVARELGIDPLELRLRNVYADGDTSVTGERLQHVGARECLVRAARGIAWERPLSRETPDGRRRGRGIACILKSTLTPTASFGYVKLDGDGSAEVITSAVEHGQGTHTVLAQIAAEELSIPAGRVRCVMPDTDFTPYDRSSTSSRTTFHMGNVVRLAAADVRAQLVEMAAAVLEVHAEGSRRRRRRRRRSRGARNVAQLRGDPPEVLRRAGQRHRPRQLLDQAALRQDGHGDRPVLAPERLLDVRRRRRDRGGGPRHGRGAAREARRRRRRRPRHQPAQLRAADRGRRRARDRDGPHGGGRLRRGPDAQPHVPGLQDPHHGGHAGDRGHHRGERRRARPVRGQGRR